MYRSEITNSEEVMDGQRHRQLLLDERGIAVPMDGAFGAVPADDVLDAAAAAWSAARIAAGTACSLPSPPSAGEDGYAAAIWY